MSEQQQPKECQHVKHLCTYPEECAEETTSGECSRPHPTLQAPEQQQRIEQAIKELEKLKGIAETEYNSAQAYPFRIERKGRVKAFDEALALLQAGGKE